MGFSKKKAASTIQIPMTFQHQFVDSDGELIGEEDVKVIHHFRPPGSRQMERYRGEVVRVKGRKMRHEGTKALWNLFCGTIVRVEGYDDLPAEDQTKGNIVQYFNDDVVRHHAENGVELLLERLQSEDADLEKK